MITIVNVNGKPTSGKDTFIDTCIYKILSRECASAEKVSSIDPVKSAAEILGCTGKTDKDRKFLSDMKALWIEYNNGALHHVLRSAICNDGDYGTHIMFTCVREESEILKLKPACDSLGIRFINVWVENSHNHKVYGNDSDDISRESDGSDVIYDFIVDNSGSISALSEHAEHFVDMIMEE